MSGCQQACSGFLFGKGARRMPSEESASLPCDWGTHCMLACLLCGYLVLRICFAGSLPTCLALKLPVVVCRTCCLVRSMRTCSPFRRQASRWRWWSRCTACSTPSPSVYRCSPLPCIQTNRPPPPPSLLFLLVTGRTLSAILLS